LRRAHPSGVRDPDHWTENGLGSLHGHLPVRRLRAIGWFPIHRIRDRAQGDPTATMLATQRRLLLRLGQTYPKKQVQPLDQPLAVAVEEAVVSGPAEAFGQDVLQQQPEKVGPGQGTGLGGAAVLGVAEGDLAVVATQDVLLRQNPAVEIAPQVLILTLNAQHLSEYLTSDIRISCRRPPGRASRSAARGEHLGTTRVQMCSEQYIIF
jgi:hypothetical protein